MKRTALVRRTPMRRVPKKKAQRRNSYARRERFPDFMLWVKTFGCITGWILDGAHKLITDRCEYHGDGNSEADHAGPRGMGQKCSDFEVIPLCKRHHDMRPGRRGPWVGLTKEEMREWVVVAIRHVHELAHLEGAPDLEHLDEYLKGKGT